MKQHITKEQLTELSERGLTNYKIYLKDKYVDAIDYIRNGNQNPIDISEYTVEQLPLLSIGQMIEFLFNNDFGPIITSNDIAFYWIIEPEKKLNCWKKYSYENSELCDALWEVVKEILECE